MILEVLLCASAAKLSCQEQTFELPKEVTLQQCQVIRQNMLDDKTGMLLPLAPYREVNCK